MAQAMKALLWPNIRMFQQCKTARYMCGYNKDLIKSTQAAAPNTDLLQQNLKHAKSTNYVLEMVSLHGNIMNNKHIIQALRSLFSLQKTGNSNLSTSEIMAHPNFKKLCQQLRRQAGTIELSETIEALKVVSYVGVHSESTIIQVLLQLIRHNINYLNLQQIVFLDFLLAQFNRSPLVDALKIALPIVFEINLSTKMDYNNPIHLAECLFFASKNQLNDDSVEKIVDALSDHAASFDAKTAKSVIWSICDMEKNDMFKPLMKKTIDSLIIHFDDLTFNDLETTLSKLVYCYSNRFGYFYDPVFFDSCSNYVIDNDLGFRDAFYIMRKFARVGHANNSLLDYVSQKILDDPELISQGNPIDIYSIVISVSLTEYRPKNWDIIKELIVRTENLTESDKREIIWIKFAAALCLLDIFRLDVLTKCLSEAFLSTLLKKRFRSDMENYSTIWQSIKLFRPDLNCLLSSKFSPEVFKKNLPTIREFPLEATLMKALGGESYVKTDLLSKYGHQIDHAVVLRKGGYPVALNSGTDITFIEELNVSPDHQIVVIQELNHINYTLNNRIMKYSSLFSIKTLESKGYVVVPICLEVWESLSDFEKIPYVMQAIKEKASTDLQAFENSV